MYNHSQIILEEERGENEIVGSPFPETLGGGGLIVNACLIQYIKTVSILQNIHVITEQNIVVRVKGPHI